MSQNTIVADTPLGKVRISAGWDHPTGQVFCNALPLFDEPEDEDDETVYPDYLCRMNYADVNDIVATLKAGGVVLPAPMVQAITRDVEVGARNIVRVWRADGTLEAEHQL